MAGKCCTFFGHRQCPVSIRPALKRCLEDLIVHYNVTMFYVGNQGAFDNIVRSVLRELAREHNNITYTVVLAYLPPEQKDELARFEDYSDTMYPEGIETVPKRFAIDWRNRWLDGYSVEPESCYLRSRQPLDAQPTTSAQLGQKLNLTSHLGA